MTTPGSGASAAARLSASSVSRGDRGASPGTAVSARRKRRVAPIVARIDGTIRIVERRKPGPPSKGEREEVRARVPVALRRALQQEAAHRGMTYNDFVGEILAEAVGVPYSQQEALKTA